jgi:CyaY protein
MSRPFSSEAEYRKQIQATLDRIQAAFESVDPDAAECEQSLGSMTISFPDRSRCILSSQPSVQQLWLALASLGTAYHFNFDPEQKKWFDDKGKGVELLTYLSSFLKEKAKLTISF